MIRRVTPAGEAKGHQPWSRSEGESEEGVEAGATLPLESAGVDPKPGELPMGRVQRG